MATLANRKRKWSTEYSLCKKIIWLSRIDTPDRNRSARIKLRADRLELIPEVLSADKSSKRARCQIYISIMTAARDRSGERAKFTWFT